MLTNPVGALRFNTEMKFMQVEDKLNYFEHPIHAAPVLANGQQVPSKAFAAHTAWVKGFKEIDGLMLMTMEPDIQRNLENLVEENTIEDAIDVDEYLSEDENVSQDEGSEHIIGTQVDNKDVSPSTSGIKKVKSEKVGKIAKRERLMISLIGKGIYEITVDLIVDMIGIMNTGVDILDVDIVKDEELIKNWEDQYGLKKGELAGPYVEEEDDPMPDNLETLDVAKMFYPGNTILADLKEQSIKSLKYHNEDNERTVGVHTDDSTITNQRKEPSLETDEDFDTPMMGSDTQLAIFESADKLLEEFEHNKRIIDLEIPSFSLGDVLFETKYGKHSSRGQIESLGPQELLDNNVLSSWFAYLNFVEGKKDKNSPAMLFLPTFEVDTKVSEIENAQTVETFMDYVDNAHSTYGGRTKLNKADIQKKVKKAVTRKRKKDEDIDDMKVASILHKFFGQYLLAINHGKAIKIIEAQLVRGTFDWQTDKRSKDCGTFLMRHMESYMGNELGK
uniref:Zinc finger, CCHC-type n=1 Tax=Tanacetum cinerariifolium TaxID=118510 RepID=A0A6L2LTP4_TANCI|nr:zinc finger, CCHC-type [Tanacetum cinerariifolium]